MKHVKQIAFYWLSSGCELASTEISIPYFLSLLLVALQSVRHGHADAFVLALGALYMYNHVYIAYLYVSTYDAHHIHIYIYIVCL